MTTKKFLLTLVGSLLMFNVHAQGPKLIVRGDDMGFSHSANLAILDSYTNGIMTTVEVMPVTPWFPEVVKMCNDNPSLDVGIHLALTSEWSNLKWRPLTAAESISDENGYFYPMIWSNDNFGKGQSLKENEWKLKHIEKELRAQIELSVKNIPHISHVSAHMGFSGMDPKVGELVTKLAEEYKLNIQPSNYGVQRANYAGPKRTELEKYRSFIKMLKNLKPGEVYLFVDHPAYNVPEMEAVHHIGYEDVAQDRHGVTKLWKNKNVKVEIEKLGIELINYKDLLKL
ncbi:MAG: ChbG/HpnK family deacetylase [Cyclobacteriaceae bacterium]